MQFVRRRGNDALEALTSHAEEILKKLNLHYRVMNLCSGDLGFSSQKTYDLEVWLPGQKRYREISVVVTLDHSRRDERDSLSTRVRRKASICSHVERFGTAIGRTVMAIMENYQQADGSIEVPEVLRPYMGGLTRITGNG